MRKLRPTAIVLAAATLTACAAGREGKPPEPAITAEQVRVVLQAARAQIDLCSSKRVRTRSDGGEVALSWAVEPDGAASMVTLDRSTVGDPSVEGCLVAVVGSLRFAPPADGQYAAGEQLFNIPPASAAPQSRLPAARGLLSSASVEKVIRANSPRLLTCYELQLRRDPALNGKVVMRWRVTRAGAVTAVTVMESSLNNAAAERCMLLQIWRWRFPAPKGGDVDVSFPFAFVPG